MSRIKDKIKDMEKYLEELESFRPNSFEEYKNNAMMRMANERAFEKIVEGLVDLAHLTIKELSFPPAIEDLNSFEVLSNRKIISEDFCATLQDAKRMRNILAHRYAEINDELIFEAVTERLIPDSEEFIKLIKKAIK